MKKYLLAACVALTLFSVGRVSCQEPSQPKARDLYYSAGSGAAGTIPVAKPPARPAPNQSPRPNPKTIPAKPTAPVKRPGTTAVPAESANTGLPGTRVVVELLRGGRQSFVNPNYLFRSGDRVRLRLSTNFDGYLSLVNIGSTGRIHVLFPYGDADDRLRPGTDVRIPKADDWIRLDNNPGAEKLIVIMSRNPLGEPEREEYMRSVKGAPRSRDLYVEEAHDGYYAVSSNLLLERPVGFTLNLKHN